jgi:hypothetical protein
MKKEMTEYDRRINDAIEAGINAFWEGVETAFPELKGRQEFSTYGTRRFLRDIEFTIEEWLWWNDRNYRDYVLKGDK